MEAGMVRSARSPDSLLTGAESGVLKPGEGPGLMASVEARGSSSSSAIVMEVVILEA